MKPKKLHLNKSDYHLFDKVIIKKSSHSDVKKGTTGTIDSFYGKGLGIKITGLFRRNHIVEQFVEESRVLYFDFTDIELVH